MKIKNKEKKWNENEYYIRLKDSKTFTEYLFTQKEANKALKRAQRNPEDLEKEHKTNYNVLLTLFILGSISWLVVLMFAIL